MAEVRETSDGRKYIILDHFTHQHTIYLDDINADGNGRTSEYNPKLEFSVRTGVGGTVTSPAPHEHDFEDYVIQVAVVDLLPRTDVDPEDILVDGGPVTLADFLDDPSLTSSAAVGHDHDISREELMDAIPLSITAFELTPELEVTEVVLGENVKRAFGLLPGEYEDALEGEVTPVPSDDGRAECLPANSVYTNVIPVDWPKRTEHEPYYSVNEARYYTTVESDHLPVDGKIPDRIVTKGVEQLTMFYSREMPDRVRRKRMSITAEYELSPRPQEGNKFLISIPARVFDNFIAIEDCQFDGQIDKRNRSTYSDLIDRINTVSREIDKYGRENCNKIPGINLDSEARRLRDVIPKINNLLKNNCTPPKQDSEIELVFSDCQLVCLLIDGRVANVGLSSFLGTDPIDNPRTSGYLCNIPELAELLSSSSTRPTLMEFLTEKTVPPCPKFRPATAGENALSIAQDLGFRAPPGRALDALNWAEDTIEAVQNTLDITGAAYQSYKTFVEETNQIKASSYIERMVELAQRRSHYAGDDIIFNIPLLVEQLANGASVEDIFSEILNKIDMGALAGFAATAVLGKIPNLGDILECAVETYYEEITIDISSFMDEIEVLVRENASATPLAREQALQKVGIFRANMNSELSQSQQRANEFLQRICEFANVISENVSIFPDNLLQIDFSEEISRIVEQLRNIPDIDPLSVQAASVGLFTEIAGVAGFFIDQLGRTYIELNFFYPSSVNLLVIRDVSEEVGIALGKIVIAKTVCAPELPALPEFSFPPIVFPTIPEIPDLPTFDFMGFVLPNLLELLLSWIAAVFLNLIAEILKSVIAITGLSPAAICSCLDSSYDINISSNIDFGGFDIEDVLFNSIGLTPTENQEVFNYSMGEILEAFVCTTIEEKAALGSELRRLLDEISTSLTSSEMLALMEGKLLNSTHATVSNIINQPQYSGLAGVFVNQLRNKGEVQDFFFHIAGYVGDTPIEEQRLGILEQTSFGQGGYLTSDKNESLFSTKFGDRLPTDRIKNEIAKITCRQTETAGAMLSATQTESTQIPLPQIIGPPGQALASSTPPSVRYMVDRTLEATYDGIKVSLEQALHGPYGFIQSLSFKGGSRQVYEQMKQRDLAMSLVPAFFVEGPPTKGGMELHLDEINERVYQPVKTSLENITFPSQPLGRDRQGRPTGRVTFEIPTQVEGNNLFFDLRGLNKQNKFVYEINAPAPNFRPYTNDSLLQVKTEEKIDLSKYSSDNSDVPSILESLRRKTIGPGGSVTVTGDPVNNPISVFAAIATEDFKQNMPDVDPSSITEYLENIAYYRTMADIITMFADEILSSKILNAETDPEVMNWRLEPSSDTSGRTHTTILDLDEIKEKAKKRYEDYVPKKGEPPTAPMEHTMLASSTETILRMHIMEIFLKTLPIFDVFRKEDVISESFAEYVSKKVEESAVRLDPYTPGYYENIQNAALVLYEEEWKNNNNILQDPITGNEMESPDRIGSNSALNYIIKKTILDMSEDILDLDIFPERRKRTIYKTLLRNMLKFPNKPNGVFDVSERVVESDDSVPLTGNPNFVYLDRFEKIPNIRNVDRFGGNLEEGELGQGLNTLKAGLETFEDGGLLLERYIQYQYAGDTFVISLEEATEIPEHSRDIRFGLRLVYVPELDSDLKRSGRETKMPSKLLRQHEEAFQFRYVDSATEALGLGTDASGRRAFDVASRDGSHEHRIYLEDLDMDVGGETSGYHGPGSDSHEHDIVGGDIKRNRGHDHKKPESETVAAAKLLDVITGDVPNPIAPLYEKPDQLRAFRLMERFENVKVIGDDLGFEDQEFQTYRITYPLPLVSVISDETFSQERIPEFGAQQINNLINKMVETDRFKILFEHCFPLQKILSLMTIYTEVVFSDNRSSRFLAAFDQVKDTLKSVFDSARNMNDFKYRDRTIESVGGNAGIYKNRKKRVFSEGRAPVVYDNKRFQFVELGLEEPEHED